MTRLIIGVTLATLLTLGFVFILIQISVTKDPKTNEKQSLKDVEQTATVTERKNLAMATNNVTLTNTPLELEPIITVDGVPYYIAQDMNEPGGRNRPLHYVKVRGENEITNVNTNDFMSEKYRSVTSRQLNVTLPSDSDTFTNSIGFKDGALHITTTNPMIITVDVKNISQNLDYNTKAK